MINFRNSEGLILPRAKMRYYLYNLSLLIYAVYIFTHESMDPSIKRQFPFPDQEKERLAKSQKQSYYFGVNHIQVGFISSISCVNFLFMFFIYTMYSMLGCIYLKMTPENNMIFSIFVQAAFLVTFFMVTLAYYELKSNKMKFLSSRKVIKLLDEQNNIFNQLPDGAMIHKTKADIRKQQNKNIIQNNRKGQILNAEPVIMNLNYTLKQMLGI